MRGLPTRSDRCGQSVPASVARISLSLIRRRLGRVSARARLPGGAVVEADLRTPLGLRLYRYGFCERSAAVIRRILGPGDTFIDGGANVGLLSLIAALEVGPTGGVIACEPAEQTMAILRRNVSLNALHWVDASQVALAECGGTMKLLTFEPGSGLSSFAPLDRSGAREEVVPVTTLDAVADDRDVTLVKLDLEGAEVRALRGARALLADTRPHFIVEVEPEHLRRQEASLPELYDLFANADYEPFTVRPAGEITRWGGEGAAPWAGEPNVLFSPRGRPIPGDIALRPSSARSRV